MTPLINIAVLNRFSDKPEIMRRLIQIYLEITPKTLEHIDAAVANGDTEQVAWHAHSLKGSSAAIGAARLAAIGDELQTFAKTGDMESVDALAGDLPRCFQETTAALEALEIG